MSMITITINGDTKTLEQPKNLAALLISLEIDPKRVAVEHNLEIAPKSSYDVVMVNDGDRLEIVHFIGGGNTQ